MIHQAAMKYFIDEFSRRQNATLKLNAGQMREAISIVIGSLMDLISETEKGATVKATKKAAKKKPAAKPTKKAY